MNKRLSSVGLQCNVHLKRKGGKPTVCLDTQIAGQQVTVRVEVAIGNGEVVLVISRIRGKVKVFESWLESAVMRAAVPCSDNDHDVYSAILFSGEYDSATIADKFHHIVLELFRL